MLDADVNFKHNLLEDYFKVVYDFKVGCIEHAREVPLIPVFLACF